MCVRGLSIKTWVNGVAVVDIQEDMTKSGFIGLQVHGSRGDTPAWVRWRTLRICELR